MLYILICARYTRIILKYKFITTKFSRLPAEILEYDESNIDTQQAGDILLASSNSDQSTYTQWQFIRYENILRFSNVIPNEHTNIFDAMQFYKCAIQYINKRSANSHFQKTSLRQVID